MPLDLSTDDAYGHGTHVAGIIGGNSYTSSTSYYPGVYRGIAPEATIINLRALDSNGIGTDSSVISAIQQAISLKSTYNIRVINLSLARGVYESYTLDPLCQAVESAWRAGIVVVVAAGNMGEYNGAGTDGYATIGAPGNDPYVITVGATNTHGTGLQAAQTMTSYSSKGPTAFDHIVKPDLVAPGNKVVSRKVSSSNTLVSLFSSLAIYPCNSSRSSCGSQFGSARYMKLSGTSMATPVVSGVAALLLQKTPSLTPDQVKARLMKSAWNTRSNRIYSRLALARLTRLPPWPIRTWPRQRWVRLCHPKQLTTRLPTRSPSLAVPPWFGATRSCGVTPLFGVTPSSGAIPWSGGTPLFGVTPSCGVTPWSGATPMAQWRTPNNRSGCAYAHLEKN